jgi:hypothetical protein
MPVVKRTKNGDKTVDISPMVKFISAQPVENGIIARVELTAAGGDYLNPSHVTSFFGDKLKVKRVVRENILF